MAIVDSVEDLTTEEVEGAEAYLLEILRENYPDYDLGRGRVLHQLLIRPAAILQALFAKNEEIYRDSASLLRVSQNPDLADEDIVDELMSNYRISRNEGTYAAGNATVVVSQNTGLAIPEGYQFTANGITFATTTAHSVFTSQEFITNSTDRMLVAREDGNYQFTIPVQAQSVGVLGKLKRDDEITPEDPPLNYVLSYAEEDFLGGENAETNEELAEKASMGISAKIPAGRDQIKALLSEQLPGLKDASIVGFGDPEMLRDRHNIFNISQGGCVDAYVRTEEYPIVMATTREATLIDAAGIWQISFDRNDYPAMYRVEYIRPEGDDTLGSFEIIEQERGLDLTAPDAPDLQNLTEGAFSSYQTLIVRFEDTDTTDVAVGDKRDYKVGIFHTPYIKTLQDYVNERGVQNPNGSYLIRALVPCEVGISMVVNRTRLDPDIDIEELKEALQQEINGIGFGIGTLEGALVTGVVDGLLPGKATVDTRSLEMRARIFTPAGSVVNLSGDKVLEIPNTPEQCVTPRTCTFTCDMSSIAIAVQTVESLNV